MQSPERRWKRSKVDIRVKVRRDEEGSKSSVVRTYELSEGGMSFYAGETLEVGVAVFVELPLPSGRVMEIRARVRNRRGFRIGLEFLELTALDRQEISRYLASLAHVIEI